MISEMVSGRSSCWLAILVAGVVLLGYLGSGVFAVDQDEVAVVLRLGALNRTVTSGLNYRLPYPFEQVYRVKVSTVYPMPVGYTLRDELRGLPPSEREMQWLTGDTNLINIRLFIQYRVNDPVRFVFRSEEPRFLVRRAAEAALTELVGEAPVDELLTFGKIELAHGVERKAQERLDAYESGLLIVSVEALALEPPEQVVSDFNDVKSAERERERAVIEAEGYRRNLLATTLGERERILNEAESEYAVRVARAEAETQRFRSLLTEYRQSPQAVRAKLFAESMKDLLPKLQITVFPSEPGRPPQFHVIDEKR